MASSAWQKKAGMATINEMAMSNINVSSTRVASYNRLYVHLITYEEKLQDIIAQFRGPSWYFLHIC